MTGAPTLTTLVSFNGAGPESGLTADSNGDLFGTTTNGGANRLGTVFEIVKTAGGYASTPTSLVSFNGTNGEFPEVGLIADATGDPPQAGGSVRCQCARIEIERIREDKR